MFIDTHVHLDAEAFDEDREQVINRALQSKVRTMINVGFNRKTIKSTMSLIEHYPFVYAVLGWHPTDTLHIQLKKDLSWLEDLCKHPKVVAIGEIGLDYHWDLSPKKVQQEVFRLQIQLAKKLKMPLVIHNREAHDDVLSILQEEQASEVGGVMHSFSGSCEMAKRCLAMNFYLSFGGMITFKNNHELKEVLSQVPMDRLLLETDCPYLTPHPCRGKRNEPSLLPLVGKEIAKIKGLSLEEIAKKTSENALSCFSIQQ